MCECYSSEQIINSDKQCMCVTLYVARRSIQLFRASGTVICFLLHSYSKQTPKSQSTHTYYTTSVWCHSEACYEWWVFPTSFSPDHVIKAQGCPEWAGLLLSVSKTTPFSCWRVFNQRRNLERQTRRGGADSTCSCPPITQQTWWDKYMRKRSSSSSDE